jgi:predicted AAA+ superfamily ATPase
MIDFTLFFDEQQRLLNNVHLKHKRYLYESIPWDERAVLITGQRGVGKTTLMLQHLKETYAESPKALYISVDNPFFKNIALYDFAIEFEKYGGEPKSRNRIPSHKKS